MFQVKYALSIFLSLISWLIFARAMVSWFIRDGRNPIVKFLFAMTEPLLKPVRDLLYRLNIGGNMVDFSPLVALLLIELIRRIVIFA